MSRLVQSAVVHYLDKSKSKPQFRFCTQAKVKKIFSNKVAQVGVKTYRWISRKQLSQTERTVFTHRKHLITTYEY